MLSKFKKTYQKVLFLLLCSLVVFGAGVGIAFLISNSTGSYFQGAVFIEGGAITIIGLMLLMSRGTSGINMRGLGAKYAQDVSRQDLDAKQAEQATSGIDKNFNKDTLFSFDAVNIIILAAGVMLVVYGWFII